MLLYTDIDSSINNGSKELERFSIRVKKCTDINDLQNVIQALIDKNLIDGFEEERLNNEIYNLEYLIEEKNNDIYELKEDLEAITDLMFSEIEELLDDQLIIDKLYRIINESMKDIDKCIEKL